MRAIVLPEESVKWLEDNQRTTPILHMANHLGVSTTVINRYLRRMRIEKEKTRAKLDTDMCYDKNTQDAYSLDFKVKVLKQKVKPGLEIGPYTVIRPFSYHCLVRNNYGYQESMTYPDLAKYIKLKSRK